VYLVYCVCVLKRIVCMISINLTGNGGGINLTGNGGGINLTGNGGGINLTGNGGGINLTGNGGGINLTGNGGGIDLTGNGGATNLTGGGGATNLTGGGGMTALGLNSIDIAAPNTTPTSLVPPVGTGGTSLGGLSALLEQLDPSGIICTLIGVATGDQNMAMKGISKLMGNPAISGLFGGGAATQAAAVDPLTGLPVAQAADPFADIFGPSPAEASIFGTPSALTGLGGPVAGLGGPVAGLGGPVTAAATNPAVSAAAGAGGY
jgi:hypothetical protein